MKSINFEFLRDAKDDHHHHAHDLAALGGFAEACAHNTPNQQPAIWLQAGNDSECYYDDRDPGSAPA